MTHNVAKLWVEERVRFDPDRLEALCQELGEEGAERVIAQGFEQIDLRVAQIKALWSVQDMGEIAHCCTGLIRVAERIGMQTLAQVGTDVRACAIAGDLVPMSATIARLGRIGDQSVHAIWTLEDVSI